jgi:hypothetical protein
MIASWLDGRWGAWHAHVDYERRPRLWVAGTVPLTTWLRHPWWGVESYRRHIRPLPLERESARLDRK